MAGLDVSVVVSAGPVGVDDVEIPVASCVDCVVVVVGAK